MWGGHSCPPPLILILTLTLNLASYAESRMLPAVGGQEYPPPITHFASATCSRDSLYVLYFFATTFSVE
jgi:hypothetical protein